MKRKSSFILLILIIFIIGLILGSTNTVGQRSYFEKAKDDFETNIEDPNHQNLPTIVEKDKTTKLAQKVDDKIHQGFEKILKKLLSK